VLTDDGPVYHALSVRLSRAKLITRFDDRYAVAKFSLSPELRTKFHREVLLFLEIIEYFLLTQCRTGGRKLTCQKPARFVHPFR